MLKMFAVQTSSGSGPEFWEENWANAEYERSVAFCEVDPLRPLFEKYLRRESLMLEGGCGMGNYVSYYSERGCSVVGVDFAQGALKALKRRRPAEKLCAGDVARLPFPDRTFDLYYSGGVVEHFEDGPEAALAEARRVLRDDGVLLISVPYLSPVRRLVSLSRREWLMVDRPVAHGYRPCGYEFFQYAYSRAEFSRLLTRAGLRVIGHQGYAVLWGLSELPGFARFTVASGNEVQATAPSGSVSGLPHPKGMSLIRRLVVSEDATVPVLGLGVRLMRLLAANMMMYVCVRD